MVPGLQDVRGVNLDAQTRCEHYRGSTDIIAIKMKCCGEYYACKDCHQSLARHPIEVGPKSECAQTPSPRAPAPTELTINQYMHCDSRCPNCRAPFNPG